MGISFHLTFISQHPPSTINGKKRERKREEEKTTQNNTVHAREFECDTFRKKPHHKTFCCLFALADAGYRYSQYKYKHLFGSQSKAFCVYLALSPSLCAYTILIDVSASEWASNEQNQREARRKCNVACSPYLFGDL